MKSLLTTTLIICSFFGHGQARDSIKIPIILSGHDTTISYGNPLEDTLISGDIHLASRPGVVIGSAMSMPDEHKKDTIAALLLVSDTSTYHGFTTGSYFFNPIARAEQDHHSINWIRGYIVRNITIEKSGTHHRGDLMWFNYKDEYYYSVDRYLDDEMKPFSKDFIIWQTK